MRPLVARAAFVVLIAVGLAGVGVAVGVATAPEASANHSFVNEFDIPVHWHLTNPSQVTIVDRTQPWPVSTATSNWNTAHHEGLVHYHWWNCSHGVQCIQVDEISDSGKPFGGLIASWDSSAHFPDNGTVSIDVNNYWVPILCTGSPSASTCRRHVACQEIGHGLGLDHAGNGDPTCMDDSVLTTLTPRYATSATTDDDHDQLHIAYHN